MANAQNLYKEALEIANKAQLRLKDITPETDAVRAAEIEAEFDRMIADATAKRSLADKMKAADELEAALTAADDRRPVENRSAQNYAGMSDEERSMAALNDYLRSGIVSDELRTQTVGEATAGGHLVPTTYANEILTAKKYYGALWNPEIVNFMATPTGEAIIYPTFDDTEGDASVDAWPEEEEQSETELAFGNLTLRSYDLQSGLFKVSYQLLRDSAFNVPALISGAMSERFGR